MPVPSEAQVLPAGQGALPTVYAATMDLPGNSYVGPGGLGELFGWPVLVGRSADAGDHAGAIKVLKQAKGKAHGLQDDPLVEKIADLIEWQQALF